MKQLKLILAAALLCLAAFAMGGCMQQEDRLVDGYYTVEMSDYSNGWKEFVSISVSNGQILAVEFNARNASGFIKAWDIQYMRNMDGARGTYPNLYTRTYAANFLRTQSAEGIDTVTGATHSGDNFRQMTALLLEKAKAGDATLGVVASEK